MAYEMTTVRAYTEDAAGLMHEWTVLFEVDPSDGETRFCEAHDTTSGERVDDAKVAEFLLSKAGFEMARVEALEECRANIRREQEWLAALAEEIYGGRRRDLDERGAA